MRLGTKSLLYGAHAFWLHPWFVAWAWKRLYGFPFDPRLWVAFIVHDWGYWSKKAMDDADGETHPIVGARIMAWLFGDAWGEFCLLHSRWFAKRLHKQHSRLCVADKLSIVLTPSWLYLPMVKATGELDEYMGKAKRENKYAEMGFDHSTPQAWHLSIKRYIQEWVDAHKEGGPDTWMNGFDPKDATMAKLPGYLDGGYEPARYKVTKADGSHNPDAKYLVIRYDSDPHAVLAAITYATSVYQENPELAEGIILAVRTELGLSVSEFEARYRASGELNPS